MHDLTWFAAAATALAIGALLVHWSLGSTRLRQRAPQRPPAPRRGVRERHATLRPLASRPAATTPPRPATAPAPLPRAPARAPAPEPSPAPAPAPSIDAHAFARSLGEELANLVSGVEGQAHLLIVAAADDKSLVPRAADGLTNSVRRLRLLHGKLAAFADGGTTDPGPASIATLVAAVGAELQKQQLGLEFEWHPAPHLPLLRASPAVLHDALLFLCAALLRLEPGARRLSVEVEQRFENDVHEVDLELQLEYGADSVRTPADESGPGYEFERQAAVNLVRSQGGFVVISREVGHAARARVRLPAADEPEPALAAPEPLDAPAPAQVVTPRRHRYGGALLLEGDPDVRAMLAGELKAAGRAVVACADGAAARSFLEATPDRFELLIVDDAARLDPQDPLAAAVAAACPDLKVCLLAANAPAPLPAWRRVHRIPKPFGVHELRDALAAVLGS